MSAFSFNLPLETAIRTKGGISVLNSSSSPLLSRESRLTMDDNPATTSGPNTISSESPEVIEKHAFASEASNDIDELAKKCDDFYENPEKFLNDIETEMKTILESFDQLFGLATKYLKQSLQFQDVSRQLQTEIKSLKSDLQDAYQMREIHVKEMSSLVATIQSLQKDRDQVVKQYHQEFVNRNDLERLQYDNEMKSARIRQLESEIAAQRVEYERLKMQNQKFMKQLATGKLLNG